MHKILAIRLYFPLDALHVSDYISPSGATLWTAIGFGICRYRYRHTSNTMYSLKKVAPDDGLIQSETCRASNGKQSLITRILCILLFYIHIVGWCTVHTALNKEWIVWNEMKLLVTTQLFVLARILISITGNVIQ